jgi:hypothetical protein
MPARAVVKAIRLSKRRRIFAEKKLPPAASAIHRTLPAGRGLKRTDSTVHANGWRRHCHPNRKSGAVGLFQKGEVDAVWTGRALGDSLEREAKARVFLEDKDTITTWLASSVKFLRDRRELAKKIAAANVELTNGSRIINRSAEIVD